MLRHPDFEYHPKPDVKFRNNIETVLESGWQDLVSCFVALFYVWLLLLLLMKLNRT